MALQDFIWHKPDIIHVADNSGDFRRTLTKLVERNFKDDHVNARQQSLDSLKHIKLCALSIDLEQTWLRNIMGKQFIKTLHSHRD